MISVTGKKWKENSPNKNLVEKLKQDYSFSDILSKLIISRNFNKEEIFSIDNNLSIKNIFSNNKDYKVATSIVIDCIKKKEKICIVGDYDVDGSSATSLLVRFLNSINHPNFYYIPDREKDGYGASVKLFKKLVVKKPKLIIMVDCGSTSNDAIDFLNDNKIKSIVVDHHEINKPFPKANCIINPKKDNELIEYNYLCATALVYFFVDLLTTKIKSRMNIQDYLIYVLLATVCDVMPLRKLNRVIALQVLENFKVDSINFFKEIYSLSKKKKKLDINDLGYLLGPILNSGGRLGHSIYATQVLSSNDVEIVKKFTFELFELNNKRKVIETATLNEIDFDKIDKDNNDVVIYYNSNINEGLIGIIAARLTDHFNKPSIVITSSGKLLKGSARSIYNYNIGATIKKALDKNILLGGGGHIMAAGFTLDKSKLKKFKEFISKDFLATKSNIDKFSFYDAEVLSSAFNLEFFNDINKIQPFGNGNPIPIFLIKDLKVIKTSVLKNKHIFSILKSKSGHSLPSIAFNSVNNKMGEYLLNYKKNLSVLAQIHQNFWNNKNSLQLSIRDIIL
ncbi:single-stranded-DNA-specific exonuclease RecJ [Candidatus Pelagibacter sp.]|nr:single-stranded-DNA-specific exonuclease RecJ [Candidatus Pelagibacter sp.]